MAIDTFVALLGLVEVLVHLLSRGRRVPQEGVVAVHEHAALITTTATSSISALAAQCQPALGEEQVDVGGLEQVVVDLVEVGDGLDDVGADVALVAEGLEAAPDADVLLLGEGGARLAVLLVGVEPELDFHDAGAVVEPVRDVGGLRVDLAHHADEGDLRHVDAVDPEGAVAPEGLLGVDDLLHRHGAQRLVVDRLRRLAPALRAPEEPPAVVAAARRAVRRSRVSAVCCSTRLVSLGVLQIEARSIFSLLLVMVAIRDG